MVRADEVPYHESVMTVGHMGFLVIGLFFWAGVVLFYAGSLLMKNRIVSWDDNWKKTFEMREGKSLPQHEYELSATLRKCRGISLFLAVSIFLLLSLAGLAAYAGTQSFLVASGDSANLATLIATIAVAIPMPFYLCTRIAVETLKSMALRVDGFLVEDLEKEYMEKVATAKAHNKKAQEDFDDYVERRRSEIEKTRFDRDKRIKDLRLDREETRRKGEKEKLEREVRIEQEKAREELLKKVE